MKLPLEIQEDIDPDCPISNLILARWYNADLSKIPDIPREDPDYVNQLYLYSLEPRDEEEQAHYLSARDKAIFCSLNGIAWVMSTDHCSWDDTISFYDVYLAMCDYEKLQYELRDLSINGFLTPEENQALSTP